MKLRLYSYGGKIYFKVELQRRYLGFVFPFLKYIFGIWDRGLATFLWDHVIQIQIRQMNFQDYPGLFPICEK
jgi:hypothetical protein